MQLYMPYIYIYMYIHIYIYILYATNLYDIYKDIQDTHNIKRRRTGSDRTAGRLPLEPAASPAGAWYFEYLCISLYILGIFAYHDISLVYFEILLVYHSQGLNNECALCKTTLEGLICTTYMHASYI